MKHFFATTRLQDDLNSIKGQWVLPFVIDQQYKNPTFTDDKQEFQVWKFITMDKSLDLTRVEVSDGNDNILFIYYLTFNAMEKDIEFIYENSTFCYLEER